MKLRNRNEGNRNPYEPDILETVLMSLKMKSKKKKKSSKNSAEMLFKTTSVISWDGNAINIVMKFFVVVFGHGLNKDMKRTSGVTRLFWYGILGLCLIVSYWLNEQLVKKCSSIFIQFRNELLLFNRLDHNDEIVSINYNNQVRDKFGNIPLEKVQLVYNALKLFDDVVHSEEMCISFKLKPG